LKERTQGVLTRVAKPEEADKDREERGRNMSGVEADTGLKKNSMSTLAMVAFVFCAVAGGAFGIEEMVPLCGPLGTIGILVVLAAAWALPYSLMAAELTSLYPGDGAAYLWARKSLGEFWGFQVGWAGAVSYYVCGASLVVLAANYLTMLFGLSEIAAMAVKIAIVVIFAIVNLCGIEESSWVSVLFSVIIILAFAAVTVVGFANFNLNHSGSLFPEGSRVFDRMCESFGIGIWMYTGWEIISNMAGEIEDTRALSRSIVIAVPLVALSYILPTVAALGSVGDWMHWGGMEVEGAIGYHSVLSTFIGPIATAIFLGVAALGQVANYHANVAGGSRAFFVMSVDKLFPPFMGKVSEKRGVPSAGIIAISVVTILFMQFDFTTLVLIQVVCALLYAVVIAICIVRSRKLYPVESRENLFVIPGGKVGMGICVGLVILVAALALITNGLDYFVMGMLFFAITGPLLYLVCKRRYGGLSEAEPETYPLNNRTRLNKGDVGRFSALFLIYGGICLAGAFILNVMEGASGPARYAAAYADAGAMLGWLGDYFFTLNVLIVLGLVMLALGLLLHFAAKRVDPKEALSKE